MKEVFAISHNRTVAHALALVLLIFTFGANAAAQEDEASPTPDEAAEARPQNADLLQDLNLSPEQKEQLRQIRQQTAADGRFVTQRVRRARRALDEAIYSPDASEAIIEKRAREFAAAQAEQIRLRSLTELKVRRVLSPNQLQTFLNLRRQAFARQRMLRQSGDNQRRPRERTLRNFNSPPTQRITPDDRKAPANTPRQQQRRGLRTLP